MKTETEKQVSDLLLWRDENAQNLIKEVCQQQGIHPDALADLVAWEREQQANNRRRGMQITFDEIFDNKQYWSA